MRWQPALASAAAVAAAVGAVAIRLHKPCQPHPEPGTAICVRCALTGSKTITIDVIDVVAHLENHIDDDPAGWVSIHAAYPQTQPTPKRRPLTYRLRWWLWDLRVRRQDRRNREKP